MATRECPEHKPGAWKHLERGVVTAKCVRCRRKIELTTLGVWVAAKSNARRPPGVTPSRRRKA